MCVIDQVLFMNPVVRRQVLACPVKLSGNEGLERESERREHLVCQLQDLFSALEHSTHRAFNPRGMVSV